MVKSIVGFKPKLNLQNFQLISEVPGDALLNVFIGFRSNTTKPWTNVWLFVFKFILTHSMLKSVQCLYLKDMIAGISFSPASVVHTQFAVMCSWWSLCNTTFFSSSYGSMLLILQVPGYMWLPHRFTLIHHPSELLNPIFHFKLFSFIFTTLFLLNYFVHLSTSLLTLSLYCPFILNLTVAKTASVSS